MGSDLTVVNSARVSFSKESEWVVPAGTSEQYLSEKDQKLVGYLAKHGHWTPFAHAFLSFRIKAPIFVARQLVKHQVGLAWNEVSRRYVDEEPEFWFPTEWRGKPVNAKQGSSGVHDLSDWYKSNMAECIAHGPLEWYNVMIQEGIAPEQARMVLPLNTMTEWIWSGSLMAFARVCQLRLDPHAQAETREVAEYIDKIGRKLFPVSWKALLDDKTTTN